MRQRRRAAIALVFTRSQQRAVDSISITLQPPAGAAPAGFRIPPTVAAEHRTTRRRAPRRARLASPQALPDKALRRVAQAHGRTLIRALSRHPVLH
ncbi:hypothetical protein PUN4_350066 [Paraburkholderia unamae]|nr:hypothetical protein PUN4_350066 [Paraburkholderia unamae]